ncbi:sensor domain-containing phosphodiesterase [Pengzhenrongella sicca]|uniref:EAL domain-containing protein n=1 Tax=Pengzhenrongella sicca TaxID=2819238 RepID=A0A8A4ZB35_9MICO|nr:EAL domain-containing protein [Pengzhenrongella sicca]QTE27796.1 EAL domain-containing protein [Pengzhenrongella sicca]
MTAHTDSPAAHRAPATAERLRVALATGALAVHYQPVVALPSGRVCGVEALARWIDPVLGTITPDEFIPIAEASGLILELGEWVLRTACERAATSPDGIADDLSVAVNVSPLQLEHPEFVGVVMRALADSGLPPRRLCLEITETAAIIDLAATAVRLTELRRRGIQIALDDFGTGYSSLTMLRSLPWSIVKIDRSFVARVARGAQDAVLVRLVIEAAHTLGMQVCAEGIEDADQARQLVAMGCDTAQGWYFGRAEPSTLLLTRATGRSGPDMFDAAAPAPVPLGSADELVVVSTPEGVITYASSTCRTMLGWTPQQLVGTSATSYFPPVSRIEDTCDRAVSGPSGRSRRRVAHRDGVDRWFDVDTKTLREVDGLPVEIISVCRDVTAVVAAQHELADSESKFRHAFDDAPIGMALSGLDGRILRVNAAFAQMLGRTAAEVLACTVAELTHPDDRAQDVANLGDLSTGAATTHHVVKRYLRRDGSAVAATVRASMINDRHGRLAYVIAHITASAPPPAA